MPGFMLKFIKTLSPDEADRLWVWLDGEPEAIQILISVAAKRSYSDVVISPIKR